MGRFFKHVLRTKDPAGARSFYSAVLGDDRAEIVPLHEVALARGAPSHWLGFIDVADVGAAAAAFVAQGAQPLGPQWVNSEGLEAAVLRGPDGAVVALGKPAPGAVAVGPDVVWQVLSTPELERSKRTYGELFGWSFLEPLELPGIGAFHRFAWRAGEPPVGALTDITTRPGVHPHWLFNFAVPALEPALEAVAAGGGTSLPIVELPSGGCVAVCDDPQGAAFALYQLPS